jgi:hypothetical protein
MRSLLGVYWYLGVIRLGSISVSAGVRLHLVHQVIRVNSSAGFCMEGRKE